MPKPSSAGGKGPLHDEATDETDADMEIVEDGEEGEMAGPVLVAIPRQPDLTQATCD